MSIPISKCLGLEWDELHPARARIEAEDLWKRALLLDLEKGIALINVDSVAGSLSLPKGVEVDMKALIL